MAISTGISIMDISGIIEFLTASAGILFIYCGEVFKSHVLYYFRRQELLKAYL